MSTFIPPLFHLYSFNPNLSFNHTMPKTAFDLYETSSPDVISVKPRSKSSRPSEIVASEKSNFITRSKWVRKRMERVFDELDVSGDGRLDSTELYAGVLLIQLELAKVR